MTRIVRFEAKNAMRLEAVDITPNPSVVRLTGKNAQGKSSVLESSPKSQKRSR